MSQALQDLVIQDSQVPRVLLAVRDQLAPLDLVPLVPRVPLVLLVVRDQPVLLDLVVRVQLVPLVSLVSQDPRVAQGLQDLAIQGPQVLQMAPRVLRVPRG